MAIARVQGPRAGSTAGTPAVATYLSTPTSGNLLIAVIRGSTAASNASISGWTKAVNVLYSGAGEVVLFYKVAGAGESTSVSVAWTSSTQTDISIEEWGGFTGTPTLDKTASTATTGGAVASRSSGTTATTTDANELCIAAWAMGASVTAASQSYTNSFVEESDIFASHYAFYASRVVTSTGTFESTEAWTTSRVCGGIIATFKGVSAAGAGPNFQILAAV